MTTIVDNGFGNMLGFFLRKYDETKNEQEKIKLLESINMIYEFASNSAKDYAKGNENSLGFMYYINNLKNHREGERCLEFFSSKMTLEILTRKEDGERLLHEKYKTFSDLENDNPKAYLINIISKHDKDLADFIISNSEINSLNYFLDSVIENWRDYEMEKEMFDEIINSLDLYFNMNGKKCTRSKLDILIHIFKENDMIDLFKKYYGMEDTSPEELDEINNTSDIYNPETIDNKKAKLINMRDIKLISEMNRLLKIKNDANNGFIKPVKIKKD